MKNRSVGLAVLLAALLIFATRAAEAQRQPLLIATIQSLDGLFSDMNYLSDAAGAGQLGQILTMTTQQYAQGLDRTRPIAVYVDAEGGDEATNDFRWLVFLPTQDLHAFLQATSSQLGEPRQLDGGIIQVSGARTLFLRADGAWTLVADSIAALQLPAMPLEQIVRATDKSATDKSADISIRGFVANMPSTLRNKALRQIQAKAQAELSEISAGGPTSELRALLAGEKWGQIAQLVQDADEFHISWNTQSERRKVALSVNLTARPGTLTFQRLNQFQTRSSAFAGMLDSSAIATCSAIGQLPLEDAVRFEQLMRSIQAAAMQEIGSSKRFADDGTQQLALQLSEALFETCRQSLRVGFFDGAGMMFIAGNELSAVTGMHVADTAALRDAATALAKGRSAVGLSWQAQLNVANYQGVALHRFSIATPNDPALRRTVGSTITITLGLGPQEVYLAWGSHGQTLIQRTIDTAGRGSAEPTLPFHSRVSMMPLLRFYQQSSDDPTVTRLLQSVATHPSTGDAATIRAAPIRNGVRFELEVDESVLRTAGFYALLARQSPQRKQAVDRKTPVTDGDR